MVNVPTRRGFLSSIVAASTGAIAGCSDTDSPLSGPEYITNIQNEGMTLIISLENEEDISQVVVDAPTESAVDRTSVDAGVDLVEFDLSRSGFHTERDPERGEYVFTAYNDEDEEIDSQVYEYNPEIAITHLDMAWTEGGTQYGADIDLLGIEFTIENRSDVPVLIEQFYYDDIDEMVDGVLTEYPYVTTGPFDVEADGVDNGNVLDPEEERQYLAPKFLTNRYAGIPNHPNDCGYEMRGKLIIQYIDETEEVDLDFNVGGQRVNPDGSQIEYCDGTEITTETP